MADTKDPTAKGANTPTDPTPKAQGGLGEIDPNLIGAVFSAIPYDKIISQPLEAIIKAQSDAATSALNFIMTVGFSNPDKDGVRKTNQVEFEFYKKDGNGKEVVERVKVPVIAVLNLPSVMIDTAQVTFDLEISQSASIEHDVAASLEGSAELGLGWGPFSVKFNASAKASYNMKNARSSDTRARQHVEVNVKQFDVPEGMQAMIEIMRNAALGADGGDKLPVDPSKAVPNTPAQDNGGGDTPAPAPKK